MTESTLALPNKCSLCDVPHTEDDDWVAGYIGVMPVALCDICASGVAEMTAHLRGEVDDDW